MNDNEIKYKICNSLIGKKIISVDMPFEYPDVFPTISLVFDDNTKLKLIAQDLECTETNPEAIGEGINIEFTTIEQKMIECPNCKNMKKVYVDKSDLIGDLDYPNYRIPLTKCEKCNRELYICIKCYGSGIDGNEEINECSSCNGKGIMTY